MDDLKLDVNGREVPLVQVKQMTMRELRSLKEISGKSPVDCEESMWSADPDVWLGMIFVSVQRVDKLAKLEDFDELNLYDVIAPLFEEGEKVVEEEKADPPVAVEDGPPQESETESSEDVLSGTPV